MLSASLFVTWVVGGRGSQTGCVWDTPSAGAIMWLDTRGVHRDFPGVGGCSNSPVKMSWKVEVVNSSVSWTRGPPLLFQGLATLSRVTLLTFASPLQAEYQQQTGRLTQAAWQVLLIKGLTKANPPAAKGFLLMERLYQACGRSS